MKILVTALEPFGGETINAALEAVTRLSAPKDAELYKLTVPTVFGLCTETTVKAIREIRPDAVVCIGQAAGRAAVTPERVAVNLRDARIPDNAGFQPVDEPVVPGGPAAYFSTLPVRDMTEAVQKAGVSSMISNTAGTFVCNDLFYGIRHSIESEFPSVSGGFIHVPCLPEQAASYSSPVPSMDLEKIVTGLEAALETLL
jgi:pyroglutamyl-peptidase